MLEAWNQEILQKGDLQWHASCICLVTIQPKSDLKNQEAEFPQKEDVEPGQRGKRGEENMFRISSKEEKRHGWKRDRRTEILWRKKVPQQALKVRDDTVTGSTIEIHIFLWDRRELILKFPGKLKRLLKSTGAKAKRPWIRGLKARRGVLCSSILKSAVLARKGQKVREKSKQHWRHQWTKARRTFSFLIGSKKLDILTASG